MNYYAKAISVLENVGNTEARRLLFKVARDKPSAIIKAHDCIYGKTNDQKILAFAKENPGKKIQWVKYCREITKMTLKQSVDHVNSLTAGLL